MNEPVVMDPSDMVSMDSVEIRYQGAPASTCVSSVDLNLETFDPYALLSAEFNASNVQETGEDTRLEIITRGKGPDGEPMETRISVPFAGQLVAFAATEPDLRC